MPCPYGEHIAEPRATCRSREALGYVRTLLRILTVMVMEVITTIKQNRSEVSKTRRQEL